MPSRTHQTAGEGVRPRGEGRVCEVGGLTVLGGDAVSGLVEEDGDKFVGASAEEGIEKDDLGDSVIGAAGVPSVAVDAMKWWRGSV